MNDELTTCIERYTALDAELRREQEELIYLLIGDRRVPAETRKSLRYMTRTGGDTRLIVTIALAQIAEGRAA